MGFCDEGNTLGLIYEYMANGNLEELLSGLNINQRLCTFERKQDYTFSRKSNISFTQFSHVADGYTGTLTWNRRLQIVVEAAQGLQQDQLKIFMYLSIPDIVQGLIQER